MNRHIPPDVVKQIDSLKQELAGALEKYGAEAVKNISLRGEIEHLNRELARVKARNEVYATMLDTHIGLANVVSSFITLEPSHPLYESVEMDVNGYLNQVFDREAATPPETATDAETKERKE